MIITSKKAKTRTYNRFDQLLTQILLPYNFYKQKSKNMYIQLVLLVVGLAFPMLQFL